MPGMKAQGTNTAIMTMVVAMIGPRTSARPSRVACFRSVAPSSSLRSTFSTTTMASSTTRATASTSPSSVSWLIEKPKAAMKAKVPISETGTAMQGMRVLRQLCRKTNTTTKTSDDRLDQRDDDLARRLLDEDRRVVVRSTTPGPGESSSPAASSCRRPPS